MKPGKKRTFHGFKGIVLERKVKNLLISEGYLAIRSPRSLGLFDVWAINKDHIRLIQIKYNGIPKEELMRIGAFDNLPNNATKEVWIYRKGEFEKMKVTTSATGELIDLFIEYCRKDCVDITLRNYERTLNDYREFIERNGIELFKIDTSEVRKYLAELYERELSPQSVTAILSSLRKFYTFLSRYNIIKENVFDRISNPKVPEKLPEVLTEAEMNKFLDSIKDPLAAAFTETLYATGARSGELLTLYCEDIDLNKGLVKIADTRGKERIIPITDKAIKKIRAYRQYVEKPFKGPIFLNAQREPLMRHEIDDIIRKCSEGSGKPITARIIRNTLASVLLNKGADLMVVKELLGLESVESVLVYAKLSIDKKKEIIDKFSSGEEIKETTLSKMIAPYTSFTPKKIEVRCRFKK